MIGVIQSPLDVGPAEIGIFLLANAIIFYICFPKLWKDMKRWRRGE
jgi:hypothetical protein